MSVGGQLRRLVVRGAGLLYRRCCANFGHRAAYITPPRASLPGLVRLIESPAGNCACKGTERPLLGSLLLVPVPRLLLHATLLLPPRLRP